MTTTRITASALLQGGNTIDDAQVLRDVHQYMRRFSSAELRSETQDKPIRMAKTVLHSMCRKRGWPLLDTANNIPEILNEGGGGSHVLRYITINLNQLSSMNQITPKTEAPTPATSAPGLSIASADTTANGEAMHSPPALPGASPAADAAAPRSPAAFMQQDDAASDAAAAAAPDADANLPPADSPAEQQRETQHGSAGSQAAEDEDAVQNDDDNSIHGRQVLAPIDAAAAATMPPLHPGTGAQSRSAVAADTAPLAAQTAAGPVAEGAAHDASSPQQIQAGEQAMAPEQPAEQAQPRPLQPSDAHNANAPLEADKISAEQRDHVRNLRLRSRLAHL